MIAHITNDKKISQTTRSGNNLSKIQNYVQILYEYFKIVLWDCAYDTNIFQIIVYFKTDIV